MNTWCTLDHHVLERLALDHIHRHGPLPHLPLQGIFELRARVRAGLSVLAVTPIPTTTNVVATAM